MLWVASLSWSELGTAQPQLVYISISDASPENVAISLLLNQDAAK